MPTVLRLTSTNSMTDGFKALQLALVRELKVVETVPCVSGAPGRQHEPFIDPGRDFAGSLRPIPEGIYAIGDIQKGTFEAGIGDTWIPLTVLPPYKVNDRSAFGSTSTRIGRPRRVRRSAWSSAQNRRPNYVSTFAHG